MNIKNLILEYLFDDDTETAIIEALNAEINIPIINEGTEEKILRAIYATFEDVMRAKILKD